MAHQHEVGDHQAARVDPMIHRTRTVGIFKSVGCIASSTRKLSDIGFLTIIFLPLVSIILSVSNNPYLR